MDLATTPENVYLTTLTGTRFSQIKTPVLLKLTYANAGIPFKGDFLSLTSGGKPGINVPLNKLHAFTDTAHRLLFEEAEKYIREMMSCLLFYCTADS